MNFSIRHARKKADASTKGLLTFNNIAVERVVMFELDAAFAQQCFVIVSHLKEGISD